MDHTLLLADEELDALPLCQIALCALCKKDKKFDSQLVFLSFFVFNLTGQLPVSGRPILAM
jgi:hypothetical protein